MTAKETAQPSATDATVARIKFEVFDRRAEELGAMTDAAKAELIEVDRVTMWRYRTGRMVPSLDRAITIASRLGLSLSDLVEQVAA